MPPGRQRYWCHTLSVCRSPGKVLSTLLVTLYMCPGPHSVTWLNTTLDSFIMLFWLTAA